MYRSKTALGEIPEFIIPSFKTESKTRLSTSSVYSLLSSCSSGAPFLDSAQLLSQKKRSATPRSRQSLASTSTFVTADLHAVRRFSEQVRSKTSVPISQRTRELFPVCLSPALVIKRNSRPSLDTSNDAFHLESGFSSLPLCQFEKLRSGSISTSGEEPVVGDAISISTTYTARKKILRFSIHDLVCGLSTMGNKKDSYQVKLTLDPGTQRHLLRDIPSSSDSDGSILPPKRVVFNGVKSASLSSKILTIKVYTKAPLCRAGKLLYQVSIPLTDVSLTGDPNWVALTPAAPQKLQPTGSISFCMCYNARKKTLMITVVNAKSLKTSALRKDSYVEVKLFRRGCTESEDMQTVRTNCHRGGSNPVYKEAFSFDFTTDCSDASRYAELTFTVRRKGFLRADKVLGKVTMSSDLQLRWKKSESLKNTLDEVFRYPGKVITQSHNLSTSY